MKCEIAENSESKALKSEHYNYTFNKETGFFARWGKTKEEDPLFSLFGPEILDIEISTICNGIPNDNGVNVPCKFCYKGNTGKGGNMTLEEFKTILYKITKKDVGGNSPLTQVALGIGDIDSNPDLWKIMEFCREIDIVPNITVNGWNIIDENAKRLSELCGAVAVSRYKPTDYCYDAVKTLTDLGMKQVNQHMMICEETFQDCLDAIEDAASDPRLEKLNAIVFLMLKPHKRGMYFTKLSSMKKYRQVVDLAFEKGIRVGFDSCSANSFLRYVEDHEDFENFDMVSEPCESTLFSYYINSRGKGFGCSFTDGEDGWNGVDVLNCDDFLKDIWRAEETSRFRSKVCGSKGKHCRTCHLYNLELTESEPEIAGAKS